jgi:hypothetical protein
MIKSLKAEAIPAEPSLAVALPRIHHYIHQQLLAYSLDGIVVIRGILLQYMVCISSNDLFGCKFRSFELEKRIKISTKSLQKSAFVDN